MKNENFGYFKKIEWNDTNSIKPIEKLKNIDIEEEILKNKINELYKLIQYNEDFKHSIKDYKNLKSKLIIAEIKLNEIKKNKKGD